MVGQHTVYIRNLNEKLSKTSLKSKLRKLFETSGYRVINVEAHKNIKLKGQAFVSFDANVDITTIIDNFNTKMLCGKPMNVQLANSESDYIIKQTFTPENFKQYLKKQRSNRLLKRQHKAEEKLSKKRKAVEDSSQTTKKAKHDAKPIPNHILILTELPEDTREQDLTDVFAKFSGFLTINLVQIRQLALIEFDFEKNAVECMKQLGDSVEIKKHKCSLAFAKK